MFVSDLLTCYSILTFKKLNWTLIIPICVYLLLENVEATSKRETISCIFLFWFHHIMGYVCGDFLQGVLPTS